MSLLDDSEKAAEYIEHLQHRLWSKNDHTQDDDLSSIICMLESPMFRQLLTLQESLQELKHVSRTQTLTRAAFDITPGCELILNESPEGFSPENIADSSTLKLRGQPFRNAASPFGNLGFDSELEHAVEKMAAGRPVHVIQLNKSENVSLGFSVVGIKSDDKSGELGIFVRDIQPGGLAAQDGRLQEGDQLLAINGQPLEVSHQEAIRVLQSTKGTAEIVVARGPPITLRTHLPFQADEAVPAAATPKTTGAEGEAEEQAEEDGEDAEEEEDGHSLEHTDMVTIGKCNRHHWMEAGGRSYQDAICGALVAAMCYMKARQEQQRHHRFQQQQQLQNNKDQLQDGTLLSSSPLCSPSLSTIASSKQINTETIDLAKTPDNRSRPIFAAEPLSTDWTQLEVIDLINDGTGLGFGIIGGRSTGVVVKTILPGGIADQDGHLRSGDHILQIGDVNVRGMSSEQVALVLRQSGSHVRLVVARSVHEPPQFQIPQAPVIPTHQLEEHMEHFNAVMAMEAGEHEQHLHNLHLQQLQQYQLHQQQLLLGSVQVHPQPLEVMQEVADVDVFEVDLMKDSHGLGITIAGYVGGDNTPDEISGIFVKSITEGSAAAVDGRVHVNDQIIEVDGKSLQGFSNHQAVEVLKNTSQMVRLKLVRFRHGPKYDKLQEYLAQANQSVVVQAASVKESAAVSNPTYELDTKQVDLEDIQILTDDYSGALSPDVEAAIKTAWEPIVGNDFLVVVAQLAKFKEGSGLGISLEGTVDVEDGVEVRPHHYIRSILPDGPVGLNGRLKSSDELLEVNGRRLLGLNHVSVVEILKDLPQHVRLVCARRKSPLPDPFTQPEMQMHMTMPNLPRVEPGPPMTERLVKAKSEMALSTAEPPAGNLNKSKSRSLEPLTGLAMWSSQPVIIELEKGDRGLGFSILDYQDPVNPNDTVIVIRSLVPGGVAQLDGRLVPGDRLMFVNKVNVEHASLDEAVQALKGAARGIVKIGVAKPLPLTDAFKHESQLPTYTDSSTVPSLSQAIHGDDAVLPSFSSSWRRVADNNSTLALHSEAELSFAAPGERRLSEVSAPAFNVDEFKLEMPVEESSTSIDRKSLSSDLSTASPEHYFAHSDSSSDGDTSKQDMRRKDSFYESDGELKLPKKVSPTKVKHQPGYINLPAYESPVPQKPEFPVGSERPVRAAAIVKPPRAGKPKRNSKTDSVSDESPGSQNSYSFGLSEKLPAFEQYQHKLPVAPESDQFVIATTAVKTGTLPLPSYEEALEATAEEVVPAPPLRSQSTDTFKSFTQGAPIAKLDSTEFDSDQITKGLPEGGLSSPASLSGPYRRGPPPIPPKPKAKGPQSSLLVFAQEKEPLPPLPPTSPPSGSTIHAPPSTPPLRPAPCSPKWDDLEAKLHGRAGFLHHRKTSSSSSSDHVTSSDLKTPPSSPLSLSQGYSGLPSPDLSPSLERTVHIQKGGQHLGLTVEAVDKAINGCLVKSIAKSSAVEQDGRIQPGDFIVSINNESLRKITNAQARAILRRSSLLGSTMTITYIPGLATGKGSQAIATTSEPQQSPLIHKLAHSLSSPEEPSLSVQQPQKFEEETISLEEAKPSEQNSPLENKSGTSLSQKTLLTDGSPAVGNQAWGPPRTVELIREPGKSLGISIVGGRVDMFNVSQEHCNAGIFIKHVLADSPAGWNGTLKKGDRILEVNGADVRNATHDEAVEVIRNASNPIMFVVQSLSFSSCPGDLESSQLKAVKSFEEPSLQSQISVTSSAGSTPHQSFEQADAKLAGESFSDSEDEDEFGYTEKRIQKKYSDLPGTVQLVDLNRGNAGMGLGLAGNKDRSLMSVFVAGIQPDSPANRDGRIQVGDELLEVNGLNLSGLSHLNASAVIKGITTPVVKLVTHRREDFLDHMAVKPLRYGGSSQFDTQSVPSVSPRGSADIDIASFSNSGRESSVTSYSPSSSAVVVAPPSPSQGQTLTAFDTIQVIVLHKLNSQSLGFGIHEDTLNGRHGIYVKSITQGGIAEKDHELEVGDEILEVGDKSLAGLHYDKALDILRASQGSVCLKVRKGNQDGSLLTASTGSMEVKMQLMDAPGESTTDPAESTEDNGDPATCPILVGKRTYIEIEKGKTGLGLSIVGGSDTLLGAIIIHEVYEDGAAARDGRLWAGDQILEVNGEDLTDATHNRALQVLRQTPAVVKMAVYRDESQVQEEDILDVFSVDLIKRPGKGLGLSIVGKKSDVGIYISDIVKGGVAEADNRLMQGDQILAVNGEDMRQATQEYAAAVLKTLMGKVNLTVGRLKAGSKASSRKNSNPGTSLKKSDSSASNKSKGRHSKSASEDPNYLRIVDLEQDASGSFGISLAGGLNSPIGDAPVIIASLNPTGPAAVSGKIRTGDKIVSINGISTEGMTHDQVINTLRSSKKVVLNLVQGEAVSITGQRSRHVSGETPDMTLKDINAELEDDGQPPQFKTITLNRGPEGLGFSIVGGHGSPHGDLPIYVKNVFNKGAAADEGSLTRGDQILSVNGQSLDGYTHEEAVNILKNTQGIVTLGILS